VSLARVLDGAARRAFPTADDAVEVFAAPARVRGAVFAFTSHLVVATDLPTDEVRAAAPSGDYTRWGQVASWIAARSGASALNGDVMLAGFGAERALPIDLEPVDGHEHPRVLRASRFRDDVAVWVTPDRAGVLVLGRGVAGRHELAFEVDPEARGRGLGRALAEAALALSPEGAAVWAQVHPGNAASLRAVLAAGLTPVGYEQLVV
jgi:ribosomal protein S18 acetylase RimI-like enzyme